MIVVAIIGVLAALAIYGVVKYLAAAKSAEAKQHVGAISRGAHAAFERIVAQSQSLGEGSESAISSHELCESSIPVPATVPPGKKYQPSSAPGDDFETGDLRTGWHCLRVRLNQPIYYQYRYTKDGSPVAPASPAACGADCYEVGAHGDLDGDGILSTFARTGQVNTTSGKLKAATALHIELEDE